MSLVKTFYDILPFNKSDDDSLRKQINKSNTPWKSLDTAVSNSNTVLELGCGQGWLSNRIANNYSVEVTGIDLIKENIDRAKGYNIPNTSFNQEDILQTTRTADTVVSIGVLHHIPDHDISFLLEQAILKSNQYCFMGLYHTSSRRAMFDFYDKYPKHKQYKLFKKMTPWIKDETQRKSWFRDQLRHPYEVTIDLSVLQAAAVSTGRKLTWCNFDNDDQYDITMSKLKSYEFIPGFVYAMFEEEK